MATVRIDDLDGTQEATEQGFTFNGVDYEIDLNKQHTKELDDALIAYSAARGKLEKFVSKAREVSNGGPKKKAPAKKKTASVSMTRKPRKKAVRVTPKAVDGASPAQVREWAQANNVEVSPTGVIQKSTYEAYNEAHQIKE